MNMSELANISFNLDYDLAWLAERVCEAKNTTLEKELVKTIRSLAEETRKEEIQRKVVSADRRALGVMRQLEIPIIEEKKSIVQPVRSHALCGNTGCRPGRRLRCRRPRPRPMPRCRRRPGRRPLRSPQSRLSLPNLPRRCSTPLRPFLRASVRPRPIPRSGTCRPCPF